ncbi:MAG TPA: hypothetical protein VNX25_01120, partial [Verrucomicrobiae bacterium]|nr:hypothetical protein [Verrucomicrobiae bacterium]
GMAGAAAYRPSQVALVRTLAAGLPGSALDRAAAVASGKLQPETAAQAGREEAIRTLELAAELARYRYLAKDTPKESYLAVYLPILRVRSTLGALPEPPRVQEPPAPEQGHLSGKGTLFVGNRGGNGFAELRWRPAYHHLLDPVAGYVPGSQIVFLETAARLTEREGARLREVSVVDIVSLAPRDRFFSPVSWKVRFGLYRRMLADHREHPVGLVNTGVGMAWETAAGIAYAMLETEVAAGTGYEHGASAAVGVSGGVTGELGRWSYLLTGESFLKSDAGTQPAWRVAKRNSFSVDRRNALTLDFSLERSYGKQVGEFSLGWSRYF